MPRLSLGVNLNRARGLANNTPAKEYIYPSQLDGGSAYSCWGIKYSPSYTGASCTVRNVAGSVVEIGWKDYLLPTGIYAGKYIQAIDEDAISTHCNGSGWLRDLFDTTPNGTKILAETTTSAQPRICNNGVIDKIGAIPSPYYDGLDDFMTIASGTYNWQSSYILANYKKGNSTTAFINYDGLISGRLTGGSNLGLIGDINTANFYTIARWWDILRINKTGSDGLNVFPEITQPTLFSIISTDAIDTAGLVIGTDRFVDPARHWEGNILPLLTYAEDTIATGKNDTIENLLMSIKG